MTRPSAKNIDWERIAVDYRAGVLSIREIAKQNDISDKYLRNRAKEGGWERDLTKKVQEAVRSQLVRTLSAPALTADKTDDEIVEMKAAQGVEVVRSHIKMIGKMNGIISRLMDELDQTNNDTPINVRTSSAVNLTTATKTMIGLERQAFNISDEPPQPEDALTMLMKSIAQRSSRLPIKAEGDE